MKFQTKRFLLKRITQRNATEDYLSWLKYFGGDGQKIIQQTQNSKKSLRQYIKLKNQNTNVIFLAIYLKSNYRHIGNIKFEPIDLINKQTTLGVLIGDPKWRSKKVFPEILSCLESYLKNKIRLKKIILGVGKKNSHAIHVYKKNGFKVIRENKNSYIMMKKI